MSNKELPKISVITVSYNAISTIESTVLSVLNQSYPNIEYIIIDGGSKDGTVDIIKKYNSQISFWKSEVDSGIYDAMNKAILHATGDWINFMNSGDTFYNENVIERIFSNEIDSSYAVVYGNTEFVYSDRTQVVKKVKNSDVHKYMPACHQSIFCRRMEMNRKMFDLRFKIAADFNFFYSLYMDNAKYLYKDIIVSRYDAMDGISSKNKLLSFKERMRITKSFAGYIYSVGLYKFKMLYLSLTRK